MKIILWALFSNLAGSDYSVKQYIALWMNAWGNKIVPKINEIVLSKNGANNVLRLLWDGLKSVPIMSAKYDDVYAEKLVKHIWVKQQQKSALWLVPYI